MRLFGKKNLLLLGAGVLTVLVIATCAVSTMAWFTTSTYPAQPANVVSGSPSLRVGKIYGYANIGGTTVREYEVGQTETTENENNEEADFSCFDVPSGDMGYYLIPEDADGQFKYSNSGVTKMIEYGSNEQINTVFYEGAGQSAISSFASVTKSLTVGKRYQIRTYRCENLKTINRVIPINDLTVPSGATANNIAVVDASKEFFVAKTNESYRIWIDFERGSLGFEESESIENLNHKARGLTKKNEDEVKNLIPTAGPNKKLIYFTNNKGWGDVKCYYWGEDTSIDWPSWPGVDMELLYKNSFQEDVYYAAIPENATSVVFNDGSGIQTQDITLSTNAYYLTNQAANGKWNVGTSSVDDLTYYFYNVKEGKALFTTPYAYAFYENGTVVHNGVFPGAAMTLTEANVFSITLPNYIDTINFSGGSNDNQTVNISLQDKHDKYFVITGKNDEGKYEGKWYDSLDPGGTNTTLFLYDPHHVMGATASSHYCYYWYSKQAYICPVWPGTQMTAVQGIEDLYSITFSNTFDKLIFNIGNDSTKTDDLNVEDVKKYYILGETVDDVSNYVDIKSTVSETTKDIYVYDVDHLFDGTPHGYAYLENDDESSDYYFLQTENASWPGINAEVQTVYHEGGEDEIDGITGLYKISVSEDFTHIIFNNGQNTIIDGQPNPNCVQMTDEAASIPDGQSYFVLDANQKETVGGITKYGGTWTDSLAVISFEARYFIRDSENVLHEMSYSPVSIGRDVASGTSSYDPNGNAAVLTALGQVQQYITDNANGILYHFEPEANDWYYKDKKDGKYTILTDSYGNVSGFPTLVKRMICDIDDLQTFYIDVSNSGNIDANIWQEINIYPFVGNSPILSDKTLPAGGNSDFHIEKRIAKNLYRVTLPKSLIGTSGSGFIVNNYEYSGGNNQTTDINAGSMSSLLTIKRNETEKANWFWCSQRKMDIGTATIKVDGQTYASMHVGDIYKSNWFVYEEGLDFIKGADRSLTVVVEPTPFGKALGIEKKTYGYDDIYGDAPSYVRRGDDNAAIVDRGSCYTLYIGNKTNNENTSYLAIAQVPSKGNGFYFIQANSGDASVAKTDTFTNCFKMKANTDTSAEYSGFTITDDDVTNGRNHIYFRSYLHGVDKPYETIDVSRLTNNEASVSASAGKPSVVTLAAGKYTFSINDSTVVIFLYKQDQWTLLDTPNSSSTIEEQNLSRILKVEFAVTSTQDVRIGLEISNPLSAYIGCSFFVSSEDKGKGCYDFMRTEHYLLSNESYIESDLTIRGGDATTYYAYILIDFTQKSVPSIPSGQLSFVLRCVQQVAVAA